MQTEGFNIGEAIRELRREQNITKEQLETLIVGRTGGDKCFPSGED